MLNTDYLERACAVLGHEVDLASGRDDFIELLDSSLKDWPSPSLLEGWEVTRQEIVDKRFYGLKHGTPHGYNRGCRGPLCTRANRLARAKRVPAERRYKLSHERHLEEQRLERVQIWYSYYYSEFFEKRELSYGKIKRIIDRMSGASNDRARMRSRMRLIESIMELAS